MNFKNCALGEAEGDEPATAAESMRVIMDGFVVLCHMVKPVTSLNKPYLSKRWSTLLAACADEGIVLPAWVDVGGMDIGAMVDHAQRVIPYLDKRSVVAGLQTISHDFVLQQVRTQLLLIYSWAGMTSLRLMADYCKAPSNCGILMPGALAECCRFTEEATRVQAETGDLFPYLRTVGPEMLAGLQAKSFPTLAYVAISTAMSSKSLGKEGQFSFKLTELGIDPRLASAFTQVRLAVSTDMSRADKDALQALAVREDDLQTDCRSAEEPQEKEEGGL